MINDNLKLRGDVALVPKDKNGNIKHKFNADLLRLRVRCRRSDRVCGRLYGGKTRARDPVDVQPQTVARVLCGRCSVRYDHAGRGAVCDAVAFPLKRPEPIRPRLGCC